MQVTTSWDELGGLGATEGPLLAYQLPATNLLPPLLSWLAVLVLLALKSNRLEL